MPAYPTENVITEFYFSALSLFAHRHGYWMYLDEKTSKVKFEGLVEHSSNPAFIELIGIEESWARLAQLYMIHEGKH